MSKTIKVRATRQGYLGGRRRAGDEFEVTEDQFSEVWMEEVGASSSGNEAGEAAPDDAVKQRTYWYKPDTGETGVTEKGETLPEDAQGITKKQYEEMAQ